MVSTDGEGLQSLVLYEWLYRNLSFMSLRTFAVYEKQTGLANKVKCRYARALVCVIVI